MGMVGGSAPNADYLGQCRMDVKVESDGDDTGTAEWGRVPHWLSGAIAAVTPVKDEKVSPKAWGGVWSAGERLLKVTGTGSGPGSDQGDVVSSLSFTSSSGSEG